MLRAEEWKEEPEELKLLLLAEKDNFQREKLRDCLSREST